MISSSRQLKDKVRNISDGNSNKASTLIRNFMMERFLERVSISSYRDNFILKGGMLVASIVGVDMRATMDIDTTVKALPLIFDGEVSIPFSRVSTEEIPPVNCTVNEFSGCTSSSSAL